VLIPKPEKDFNINFSILGLDVLRSVVMKGCNYFFNSYSGGIGVQLGPLSTAATNDLLCQPRAIVTMEKLVE
jgi:hypothetical protein